MVYLVCMTIALMIYVVGAVENLRLTLKYDPDFVTFHEDKVQY